MKSEPIQDARDVRWVSPALEHLRRMTDHVGIVQHARLAEPNYDEGYCVDDNARALMLMCKLSGSDQANADELSEMAALYLLFVVDAWNPHNGRFRNFRSSNLLWLEIQGSEDSHGRSLHALGCAANCEDWSDIAIPARSHFEQAIYSLESFTSPRAWAFALLGIDEYLKSGEDRCQAGEYRSLLAQRLFELYQSTATDDWPWFEGILSYCNAKLPHALLSSGYAIGHDDMVQASLDSMTWLSEIHSTNNGVFSPIGSNGFYRKDKERARFDQQPIEANAAVAASLAAFRLTSDEFWLDEANRAYQWFHGNNDLGILVCDPESGSCYDGLHPDRVNQNLGAESTLAYLLSCADFRELHCWFPCPFNGE